MPRYKVFLGAMAPIVYETVVEADHEEAATAIVQKRLEEGGIQQKNFSIDWANVDGLEVTDIYPEED